MKEIYNLSFLKSRALLLKSTVILLTFLFLITPFGQAYAANAGSSVDSSTQRAPSASSEAGTSTNPSINQTNTADSNGLASNSGPAVDPSSTDQQATDSQPASTTPSTSASLSSTSPSINNPSNGAKTSITPSTGTSSSSSTSVPYVERPTSNLNLPDTDNLSGGLNYKYPLQVPPGRNNLQPNLELQYSSDQKAEDSAFGYGWNINIPYIERVNKTGTNSFYSSGSTQYFESSLSGELVPATPSSTTNYISRVDNGDFLSYTFSNNQWTAVDKTGTQYLFGLTSGSRQDNPSDSTQVFKWMLEKEIDTNGNFISYTYFKDSGQIYPSTITYTNNGSNTGIFTVSFNRESRTDYLSSYQAGFLVITNFRVNQIQVSVSGSWVHQWNLAYTTGDDGVRSILQSITETGKNEAGSTVSLPAIKFNHQKEGNLSLGSIAMNLPSDVLTEATDIADINGDGLPDLFVSYITSSTTVQKVYLNNGNGGWVESPSYAPPLVFTYLVAAPVTKTHKLVDVNGDGLPDLVYIDTAGCGGGCTGTVKTYMNTGSGWSLNTNWQSSFTVNTNDGVTADPQIMDVNGDGLPDLVRASTVYLNTGSGWSSTSTAWSWPVSPVTGNMDTKFADLNGDGIMDEIQSINIDSLVNGVLTQTKKTHTWLGDGKGGFVEQTGYASPILFVYQHSNLGCSDGCIYDTGVRVYDYNGDGLPDLVQSTQNTTLDPSNPSSTSTVTRVYLNTGIGWTAPINVTFSPYFSVGGYSYAGNYDFGDNNGDGVSDIFDYTDHLIYYLSQGQGRTDLLSSINYPEGGNSTIQYESTTQYKDSNQNLLNPHLAEPFQTISQIVTDDGSGNSSNNQTTNYSYSAGTYYYNNALDRKIAGFGLIAMTDAAGNLTRNYYHTSNGTDTIHGEYQDNFFKIGKIYRTEIYNNVNSLYKKVVNKWDDAISSSNPSAAFVQLKQTLEQDYDGYSDHTDKAESYTYDNTTGNQTQKIEYGQVTGNDDGTFTDTGADLYTTNITYAANTTGTGVIGLPQDVTVLDQSTNKVKEQRFYYDTLALGSVDKGNLTKEEDWKAGTTYINTQKSYDGTYGLVTQELDPRGKATNYTYDSYNLYPAIVTNALNQQTQYLYNYAYGKVKQKKDPNNLIFQTTYDGLGRIIAELQPDQVTPTTLDNKTTYTYTDVTNAVSVQKTDYLDGSNSVNTYSYFDGLHRLIQTRKTAEDVNNYEVTDTGYNNMGLKSQVSLPYFSTGLTKTAPTTTTALLTTYTYDPLQREVSETNEQGTKTNTYHGWKLTTTDENGKTKDLLKDAYGNLVEVDEHNQGNTYLTKYAYDGLNDLTNITDANENVRNFTYDGLGRRLTAQDLHSTTSNNFGTWSYAYDDSGNLTSRTDPKNQVTNYTYDDINRPLYESLVGNSNVGVTYTYDSCTNGKGRLCSAANESNTESKTYDPLGNVVTDQNTIDGTAYTSSYAYDRQGNITQITNPDNSQVQYTYNIAGLVESVSRKESTDSGFTTLIANLDYSPTEQVTNEQYANGTTTTNTYDPNELYRLKHKLTTIPDTGLDGDGVESLPISQMPTNNNPKPLASINSGSTSSNSNTTGQTVYLSYDPNAPILKASPAEQKFLSSAMKKAQPTYKPKVWAGSNSKATSSSTTSPTSGGGVVTPMLSPDNGAPDPSTNMNTQGLWLTESTTYNDGFENGANKWNFYSDNGGAGVVDCTVAADGSCSYKVVNTASNNSYDTIIYQQQRVDTNVNYKVTFKAKAAAAGNMVVSVNQNHSPYYDYGLGATVNLSTNWQSYSYTFTSWGSDTNARVWFGLGANANTTWIDDVEVVPDSFNTIQNPSFETGTNSNWSFYSAGGTGGTGTNTLDCTVSTEGNCSNKTNVTQAGNFWEVQLNSAQSFNAGTTYVVKFDAESSVQRQARVALAQNHSPYSDLSPEATFTTNTNWNTYEVQFTPTSTDSNARLVFNLGEATGGINIDNVRLFAQQPTRITTGSPNFTAIFSDPDTGDTAIDYEIQLIKKGGDFNTPLWDSGEQVLNPVVNLGSRTQNLPYTGPALAQDGTEYYWRIALWDAANNKGAWTNGRDYFFMAGRKVQDLTYTYDKVGNILTTTDASDTDTNKTITYGYDDLYRLTSAVVTGALNGNNYTQTYSYDPVGNITYKSDKGAYSYSGAGSNFANPDAVTSIGSTNFTYDLDGNLATSSDGRTNTWNYNNRLTQEVDNGATTTYGYDYSGERVKYVNSTGTTYYPSKYYNVTSGTPTKHIFVNGEDVATITGSGANAAVYNVSTDTLTSANVVSGGASAGGISEVADYYPFGSLRLDEQNSPFREQRKFAGHEYDQDTQLSYQDARYYNPKVARWVSEDQAFLALGDKNELKRLTNTDLVTYLSDPQNLNSFSYVRNNPVNGVDSTGQFSWNGYVTGVRVGFEFLKAATQTLTNNVRSSFPSVTLDQSKINSNSKQFGSIYLDTYNGQDQHIDVGALVDLGSGTAAAIKETEILRGTSNPLVKEAARIGMEQHKIYNPGPEYTKEFTFANGLRADAIDFTNKIIRELKPDNSRAIQRGYQQLEKYIQQANKEFGPGFRGILDTYKR